MTTAEATTILKEMRSLKREVISLRREVELSIPLETLDEYENPEQIRKSYRKAVKKFPISSY